jgi:hypothetical protein
MAPKRHVIGYLITGSRPLIAGRSPFSRACGFFCGCTASRFGSGGRCSSPFTPSFASWFFVRRLPSAGTTWFFATPIGLVHGRPGTSLGFFLWDTAIFISFLDVFRLSLLLFGVLRFITAGHFTPLYLRLLAGVS